LYHVGAAGCCPLGLRLYLPRGWLTSAARLEAAGVPPEHRLQRSKGAIALDLLDEARAEGWSARLTTGGPGFGGDRTLREALAARGLTYLLEVPDDATAGDGETRWPADGGRAAVGNAPAAAAEAAREQAGRGREAAREAATALTAGLGLDHFEGRSWRGFHHHACLVLLAYAFRLLDAGREAPAGSASAAG
jgi:SRSO17 transposase